MTPDEVIAAARERTGLTDYGDPSIRDGLERLCEGYRTEAHFTQTGAAIAYGELVSQLANRLKVEDWLARHPEILEKPVEKPLFVFGLPRTGTTLLINLIAADPARRSLVRWTAFDAVPPPRPEELTAGPRWRAMQDNIEMSLKYVPQVAAIHYEDAHSPTECQFAMTPSFCAQVYEAQADIPSYRQWLLHEADYGPAFRYEKRLLQLLQSEAPGRWTLKNPWHPLWLNALTAEFPDAQLVMTHRDPADVLASTGSLIQFVRQIYSDDVDPHRIGRDFMETFRIMIDRQQAFRDARGPNAILDVHYAQVMRDPIGEVRKIYEHFDEELTPAAEAAMHAYMADNPHGKHGKHSYALETYGLTREAVHEEFRDYIEAYDIQTRVA